MGDSASKGDLHEVDYETDESESEFDKTIRSPMLGLRSDVTDSQQVQPQGARRSERQKKPSSI